MNMQSQLNVLKKIASKIPFSKLVFTTALFVTLGAHRADGQEIILPTVEQAPWMKHLSKGARDVAENLMSSTNQLLPAQPISGEVDSVTSDSGGDIDYRFVKPTSAGIAEKLEIQQGVTAHGVDLMGEQIGLANGSMTVTQTDDVITGQGPAISLIRNARTNPNNSEYAITVAGGWELAIPHLKTSFVMFSGRNQVYGQWLNNFPDADGRNQTCNSEDLFLRVYSNKYYNSGATLSMKPKGSNASVMAPVYTALGTHQFYNGVTISVPGQIEEQVLGLTTKSGWDANCIDSNDSTYSTFYQFTSTDGTKYTFDQPAITLNREVNDRNGSVMDHYLLVTKIEDRFGNTVNYSYTDANLGVQLNSITASDGRRIEFQYDEQSNEISEATIVDAGNPQAKLRTWKYTNENVERPDGSVWQFGIAGWRTEMPDVFTCSSVLSRRITLTHPDGARATYQFENKGIKKARVSKRIQLVINNSVQIMSENCSASMALVSKTLTYDSGKVYTWTYDYQSGAGFSVDYDANGRTGADPAGDVYLHPITSYFPNELSRLLTKSTTVTAPDNSKIIYYFNRDLDSTYYDAEVGRQYIDSNGTLLQTIVHEFDDGLAKFVGAPLSYNESRKSSSHRSIKTKTTITNHYDGADESNSYITEYNEHNDYGIAQHIKESYGDNVRHVRKGYLHVLTEGEHLLNLPTTVKVAAEDNQSAYTTVSEQSYTRNNAANATVQYKFKRFGVLQSTNVSYDSTGNLTEVQYHPSSSDTRTVKYSNFERGIPQTITQPARYNGAAININRTVNKLAQVTRVVDANGNGTNYTYDELGRIASVNPDDNKWLDTKFTWAAGSRIVERCVLSNGLCNQIKARITTDYDSLLRPKLEKSEDLIGFQNPIFVRKRFNSFGATVFASYPSHTDPGATSEVGTKYFYDGMQRLYKTSVYGNDINGSNGESLTTYQAGNAIATTNFRGNKTTTTYQAFGNPSYKQPLTIVSQADASYDINTSLDVDVFGNVKSITQSGNGDSVKEQRIYNSNMLLCKTIRLDVGNTYYEYNNLGQLTYEASGFDDTTNSCAKPSSVESGKTYTFDNLGDVKSVSFSGTATPSNALEYTLDNNGNLTGISDGKVVQTYGYYSNNGLSWENLNIVSDSREFKTTYDYSSLGHLKSISYPKASGETTLKVDYEPNSFGLPLKATSGQSNYATDASYNANGNLTRFTYGNGVLHLTTYDDALRPESISDKNGGVIYQDQSYTYDGEGNIRSITNNRNTSYSLTRLDYDALDRLKSASGSNDGLGTTSLVYDAIGNIKSYTTKGRALSYSYTNNRLTGLSGLGSEGYNFGSNSYDKRGNIINSGKGTFIYNQSNQMIASSVANNSQTRSNTYLYDGHNRRVKQIDSKGTAYSVYSQQGTLLYRETNVNSETKQGDGVNYIYLGKKLIAKDGYVDAAETDEKHNRPFGESLVQSTKNDIGYTGHVFDVDLGLNYMQARYYDPVIGRFYSNDPVDAAFFLNEGNIHGFNRYTYGNNNPYKFIDPDGRSAEEFGNKENNPNDFIAKNMEKVENTIKGINEHVAKTYAGVAAMSAGGPAVKGTLRAASAIKSKVKVEDVKQAVETVVTALEFTAEVVAIVTSPTPDTGDKLGNGKLDNGKGAQRRTENRDSTKKVNTSVLKIKRKF